MIRKRLGIAAVLVGALAVTSACSSSESETTGVEVARQIPTYYIAVSEPHFSGTPELAARIREIEGRTSYMARLHTEGIREAMKERESWSKADRKNADLICNQALRLGLKYAKKANTEKGLPAGRDADHYSAAIQGLRVDNRCTALADALQARAMSVFSHSAANSANALSPAESRVTDLAGWMSALNSAMVNSGPVGYQIVAAMDTVLVASESELSSTDFEGMVAVAQIGLSSLIEWQTLYNSGSWGGGGGGECEVNCEPELRATPLSMFAKKQAWVGSAIYYWWLYSFNSGVRNVTTCDVVGALGGWFGGPAAAVAGALIGSIACYQT